MTDCGTVALAFTEEMRGELDVEDLGRAMAVRITVSTDDVERFLEDEDHVARVSGSVRCAALGGLLDVEGGHFRLAVDGHVRRMQYRLLFHDGAGRPLALSGDKEVSHAPGHDLWRDMSTLRARLHAGHEPDADAVATALLHMEPADFARQLTSIRISPPLRLDALARFGALFAGALWDAYR
jgi:cholesterol oxidase